jgi:flagellar assembly protein FliH
MARSGVGVACADAGADEVEVQEQALSAEEIRALVQAAEERGYEDGRSRAVAELASAVTAAGTIAERLQSIAPERTADVAHAISELALFVARRVLGREVELEPSLLCSALEAAVATINGSPEAHVVLHPAAVKPVREAWEARHGLAYLGKRWLFEGDPTLPVGGCTLRYEHGFVEAGLEAQLDEIGIAMDRAIPNLAVEEGVA